MEQEKLRLKKGDFIAFFAILALSAGIFGAFFLKTVGASGGTVQAYQNGELLWEKPLSVDGTYEIHGEYTNIVTISKGKVSITASDCVGEDCVRMGFASPSRPLVCLPNRVEIRLVEGGTRDGLGGDMGYDVAVG